MNCIAVLSCLSLLLTAAAAQQPKPCVSPPLMSGGFSLVAGDLAAAGSISYDAFGQRIHARNFVVVGNETYHIDQLFIFRQKVYYEIDWKATTCRKFPLDTAFIPMQVPPNATLSGPLFLGSSSAPGMGVLVNNWLGPLPNNGYLMSVFTEIGCIPMTFMSFTPSSGYTMVSTFNWVLGLTDPSSFSPPFFCSKSKLEVTETPENVFGALKSLALKAKAGGSGTI